MADIVSRKVGEQVTVCGFEAGDKVVCTAQAVNGAGPSPMSRPYSDYTDANGMYYARTYLDYLLETFDSFVS